MGKSHRIRVAMVAILVLWGMALSGPAPAANDRKLTLAIEPWAPFAAPDLPRKGFLSALTQAAFDAAGYSTEVEFLPWARAQLEVSQGDRHALMGLYFTEERAEEYLYTEPVYETGVGLVGVDRFEPAEYDSLRDLDSYTIGVGRGYATSADFEDADYLDKEVADDLGMLVRMLFRKRVDLVTESFDRVREEAREQGHDPARLVYLQPPLKVHNIHVGISRALDNGPQIRDAFDRGLAEIRADGTYDEILAEFGVSE